MHMIQVSKRKPQKPRNPFGSGNVQYPERMQTSAEAIHQYMEEHGYKPNDIWLRLYLKRVTRQYAVYANDQLKIRGIYLPIEILSDPPKGVMSLRLTSPFL